MSRAPSPEASSVFDPDSAATVCEAAARAAGDSIFSGSLAAATGLAMLAYESVLGAVVSWLAKLGKRWREQGRNLLTGRLRAGRST